ncbi:autotransporter domain-containing protein [Cronobacter dublinensis]|uniref:autotransporter outer membrane beta-barrel domain-containing protein n=1 Tax=Cronobacter dublinensis TaxID=413497 RepID=UPI0024AF78B0|nr:autotransporter domain-containing protein [Cronobacter dublinensis]MDI7505416.1 autotransporter domain-containing protein [Cronobacter dublinensis]
MKKSRFSQQGTLLVALTSAQGLLAPYAFAVSSDYVISGQQSDVQISSSYSLVQVTNTGSALSSAGSALSIGQGVAVTLLDNDGVISAEGNSQNTDTYSYGLKNEGTIDTIDNSGSIKMASASNNYYSGSAVNLTETSQVGTLINSGTIEGPDTYYNYGGNYSQGGITNSGTLGTLKNISSGVITGRTGVSNLGKIDLLENAGVISSTTTNTSGYNYNNGAIYNTGTINTLHNTGTIGNINTSTSYYNSGIFNTNTGIIKSLTNDGKIASNYVGVYNLGQIDTLTNNGDISGNLVGIYNGNTNSNSTAASTIINNGTVSGSYGFYATNYNSQTTTTTLINNGTITGSTQGVYITGSNGASNAIINNGTITGKGNAIFTNGTNGSALTITNSGIIEGNISSNNGAALEFIGGTDKQGVLTGVSTVSDDETASSTNGIGTIASNSDVIFRSGSMLLNDNINVASLTTHSLSSDDSTATVGTVLNDAAQLQINAPIAITGNYHQNAGAALIVGVSDTASASGDIAQDTSYGRLNVTGSATVDQGSSISLTRTGNTYKFAPGQRYVVINANSNGTNYNADKLAYKAVGYAGKVTGSTYVDETNSALVVQLEKAPTPPVPGTPTVPGNPTTPTVPGKPPVIVKPPVVVKPPVAPVTGPERATTSNATSSLNGLASYSGIAPQLLELYNASLAIEGTKEANRVGERLSTSQNINVSTASGVATSTAMGVVGNHLDTIRSPQTAGLSGVSTGDGYSDWIVWAQPYGGYTRQDSTSEVSGYSAKFGGLLFGADRTVAEDWRVGAALNYSNTSVHGKDNLTGNNSTANNYGVIGYAGYSGDPWFVNLSAALTRQNYDTVRRADFTGFSGTANGKFNGQSVTLQSEFGYPFTLPAAVVITPMAGLTYGYQHVDGYKESGGNGMALDVGSSHSQSVTSDLGTRIEKGFDTGLGRLTPFAQVSWIHQYDNRRTSNTATYAADTIGETQFTTKGAAPVKDMAGLSVGSTLFNASDLSIDARYDLQAAERYQAHTFSLRLNKSF